MYEPKETEQMTTALKVQRPISSTEYGVKTKTWTDLPGIIMVNFKTFGGTERVSNDGIFTEDTALITTRYRPDIKSDCRVVRLVDNAAFEITGPPENIELRNKWLVFKVRRIKGGA